VARCANTGEALERSGTSLNADEQHETDYETLANFRYRLRLFLRFSEHAARSEGLLPQQYQLMLQVKGLPPGEHAHIAYLSERLQIRHHSAVELIDRLAAKGFVLRQPDRADRRRVFVELTAAGEQAVERLARHHVRELQSSRELVRSLNALVRKMDGD